MAGREQFLLIRTASPGARNGWWIVSASIILGTWLRSTFSAQSDEDLLHVTRVLSQVEELSFYGSSATDAGLVHLEGLARLKFLSLSYMRITDAGVAHLEGLTNLHRVGILGAPTSLMLHWRRSGKARLHGSKFWTSGEHR